MRGVTASFEPKAARAPRPKQPNLHEWQFYPPRLFELLDQETFHHRQTIGYKVKRPCVYVDPGVQAQRQEGLTPKEQDQKLKEDQEAIDSASPLTEAELQEKEELLALGWSNWSRRDFSQFIKANERCAI